MTSVASPTRMAPPPSRSSQTSITSTNSSTTSTTSTSLGNSNLKLTIRLLPPTLSESQFMNQLATYYPYHASKIVHFYYHQGSLPTKLFDLPEYSRGYISFNNTSDMNEFLSYIKGKSFHDDKDDCLIPIVEKSIYNKMIDSKSQEKRKRKKKDVKIEDDEIYIKFEKFINQEIDSFDLIQANKSVKKKGKVEDGKKKKETKEEKAIRKKLQRKLKKKEKKKEMQEKEKHEGSTSETKKESKPGELKLKEFKLKSKKDKPKPKKVETEPPKSAPVSKEELTEPAKRKRRRKPKNKEKPNENKQDDKKENKPTPTIKLKKPESRPATA